MGGLAFPLFVRTEADVHLLAWIFSCAPRDETELTVVVTAADSGRPLLRTCDTILGRKNKVFVDQRAEAYEF